VSLTLYESYIVNQYAQLAKLIKILSLTYDGGEVFGRKIYMYIKQDILLAKMILIL
jgi:hypothetical protein